MLKYIIKRLLLAISCFLLIIFCCFILTKISITKPLQPPLMSDLAWKDMCEKEGYDKPALTQFWKWFSHVCKGDFGFSTKLNQNVYDVVKSKIPITFKINIIPTLLSVPLGILLAILTTIKKNSWIDYSIIFFAIIVMTLGTLVIAIMAQYLFVHVWHLFPYQVSTSMEWKEKGFWFGVNSYLLPLAVMTLLSMVFYIRKIRAELIEQTNKNYFLLVRSKGLTFSQTINLHALKNSLVPYAPVFFDEFVGLITGSFLIERIFSIDGVGRLMIEAFQTQD
ncbi:ABC transporter permease [Paulownia witches'-broom phytoplasma]|uniref:ABC transporter permease n=1 Tax=Paulownia witches'-broom phytoplasma TaxID=39647 RepID=A0ABX8TP96_9MOLU|nr:ABC transporter permease [Paulownia witches'-broom phytoplasma]QYC30792.1 ABC transporter permease [Paulownia witches'-broom phytoplasma]GLH60666.1 peptide ABC transporter permease [Paulownia witches'-broom phytoplasma]